MGEYIEREAFLKWAREFYPNDKVFASAIINAPAADVAPVVHGRWNSMDGYKTRVVCSECGWDVPEYGKFYSYCPNCGVMVKRDFTFFDVGDWNFCPNCGEPMEGGAENAAD